MANVVFCYRQNTTENAKEPSAIADGSFEGELVSG